MPSIDRGAELAEVLAQEVAVERYGAFVVDTETGVVYEGLHAWDLDQLIEARLQSNEQEKQWKARGVILGIVLQKRLELEGVTRYTSPGIGQAQVMPNQRRAARITPEIIEELAESHGLEAEQLLALLSCARELSVTDIDKLLKTREDLRPAALSLITTSGTPFVKTSPALLEASSRVTKETRKRGPRE